MNTHCPICNDEMCSGWTTHNPVDVTEYSLRSAGMGDLIDESRLKWARELVDELVEVEGCE